MTTITRRSPPVGLPGRPVLAPLRLWWQARDDRRPEPVLVQPARRGALHDDPDGAEVYDEFHGETVVLARCRCADDAPPDWQTFCYLAHVPPDTTRTPDDLAARYHRETGNRIHPDMVAALREAS